MKDTEIFALLEKEIGLSEGSVVDYRPCSKFYTEKYGIPTIKDAIVVMLRGNGSLIYIPERDMEGNQITRNWKGEKDNG